MRSNLPWRVAAPIRASATALENRDLEHRYEDVPDRIITRPRSVLQRHRRTDRAHASVIRYGRRRAE